jgi:MazG family protein
MTHAAQRLQDLIARLRDPQHGCPWDRRQTHQSLAPHLVEETYEVLDALDAQDDDALCEELGDLAFLLAFHAHLAHERGAFDLETVLHKLCDKMTARHPHVFGDATLDTAQAVQQAWEQRKQTDGRSLLDGVPRALPALQRAERLTAKAATVGFDWTHAHEVMAKIEEELAELKDALAHDDPAHIQEELGDLLFSVVNLARKLNIHPEQALQSTNQKFDRRFRYIETSLHSQGRTLQDSNLEEMDVLWREAKSNIDKITITDTISSSSS